MKDENSKDIIIIYEKGDNKMKERLIEYVKLGFGFYIGYNMARALKRAIIKTNK